MSCLKGCGRQDKLDSQAVSFASLAIHATGNNTCNPGFKSLIFSSTSPPFRGKAGHERFCIVWNRMATHKFHNVRRNKGIEIYYQAMNTRNTQDEYAFQQPKAYQVRGLLQKSWLSGDEQENIVEIQDEGKASSRSKGVPGNRKIEDMCTLEHISRSAWWKKKSQRDQKKQVKAWKNKV